MNHRKPPLNTSAQDAGFPAKPTPGDTGARIRAAATPAGLLSLRDPERLRRYILDAGDESQQELRQQALLDQGFCTLSTWPDPARSSAASSSRLSQVPGPRVVNLGLYAWPVVVCLGHTLGIKHTISLGYSHDDPYLTALGNAWASALGVAGTDVRAEGAVSVHCLAGLSPLLLQSSLSNESRRLAFRASQAPAPAITSPAMATPGRPLKPAPWSLILDARPNDFTHLEADQPVVFLLTAYVAWDLAAPRPTYQGAQGDGTHRMRDLVTAFFTHGLKASLAGVSAGAVDAPSTPPPREPRIAVKPTIRLGRAQPLHDAVTEGQWMQMAWMAERARKTDRQFSVSLDRQGSFLTWTARVLNGMGEDDTALGYTYDGFWRPASHVRTILNHVDLAQGTGQMPTQDQLGRLMN